MFRSCLCVAVAAGSALAAPVPKDGDPQIAFCTFGKDAVQLFLYDGRDEKRTVLTDSKMHARWPAWSPDGRKIAYCAGWNDPAQLFVTDAAGGNVRQLTEGAAAYSCPAWSPDGKTLLVARSTELEGRMEICRVPATGGEPEAVGGGGRRPSRRGRRTASRSPSSRSGTPKAGGCTPWTRTAGTSGG